MDARGWHTSSQRTTRLAFRYRAAEATHSIKGTTESEKEMSWYEIVIWVVAGVLIVMGYVFFETAIAEMKRQEAEDRARGYHDESC